MNTKRNKQRQIRGAYKRKKRKEIIIFVAQNSWVESSGCESSGYV